MFDVSNCVRPFGSVNSLPVPVIMKPWGPVVPVLFLYPKNTPIVSLNAIPLHCAFAKPSTSTFHVLPLSSDDKT